MTDRHSEEALPLTDEELRVEKRRNVTGKVRIRTVAEVTEEVARASLEGQTIEVTRVPIDRDVQVAPSIRTEGDLVIIPVVEEVLVVEKRLVLKEELHVRRRFTQEDVEVPITLRKQKAVIERVAVDGYTTLHDEEAER